MHRAGFEPASFVLRTRQSQRANGEDEAPDAQIAISTIAFIVNVMSMTTISVTDDVKEKLLKVASELQIKLGRRVDLNDALRFLVEQREKKPAAQRSMQPNLRS